MDLIFLSDVSFISILFQVASSAVWTIEEGDIFCGK
jgi:hypothetical protein